MLGRLARWLRVLGYDAAFDPGIADAALVKRAIREERAILTRDRALPEEWRIGELLVLESDDPLERLREVAGAYDLEWPRPLFRRCLECNEPLRDADPREVEGKVPDEVRRRHSRFTRCPSCRRVYWEGDHVRRMRQRLADALGA